VKTRASGILLHISSLPSEYGIGDFGSEAYKFADFLHKAKQCYWQILPVNQISYKGSYSPYDCLSAFAGNTLFISPELLVKDGLLSRKDIRNKPSFSKTKVNYPQAASFKKRILNIAYENFSAKKTCKKYQQFCLDNYSWLKDFATFMAIRQSFKNSLWCTWPIKQRDRKPDALKSIKNLLDEAIDKVKFQQYIFFKQWLSLKNYCHALGIKIIGDIPIYVLHDSSDVWTHPEIFKLTKTKRPHFIAGVPPDYFSRNGQLWGNPVYNWKVLKQSNYQWWLSRVEHNLNLFDIVRLDHFRGFAGFWQVPADSRTARNGRWASGPKEDFLDTLFKRFSLSHFVVEDLGYTTADVRKLIEKYQLTCMKVLMFGFDQSKAGKLHHPSNCVKNSVVYTGTHDNNTVKDWFKNEATPSQRNKIFNYIGHKIPISRIHWEFVKLAMSCASNTAIIPMQDILGLGQQSRMNIPATAKNNWTWRLQNKDLKPSVAKKLAELTEIYGRV
jgi:4-alpha-glucanotransferase